MTFVICFKLSYINVQFLPGGFVFKHELCCLQPQVCYGSTKQLRCIDFYELFECLTVFV